MNTTDKIMTIVGEAFREGFYSVRTYNDTVLNNADEEFQSAATSLAKKVIAEIEALVRDAERLDWMIFHSATVRHSSDGEFCTVTWYDDEGQAHETKPFGSARQAIDTAMQEKQS